jgi:hypothetical protein
MKLWELAGSRARVVPGAVGGANRTIWVNLRRRFARGGERRATRRVPGASRRAGTPLGDLRRRPCRGRVARGAGGGKAGDPDHLVDGNATSPPSHPSLGDPLTIFSRGIARNLVHPLCQLFTATIRS